MTECGCQITLTTPFGETVIQQNVALVSDTLPDDWTDSDLISAVSTQLNVPIEDVTVDL